MYILDFARRQDFHSSLQFQDFIKFKYEYEALNLKISKASFVKTIKADLAF